MRHPITKLNTLIKSILHSEVRVDYRQQNVVDCNTPKIQGAALTIELKRHREGLQQSLENAESAYKNIGNVANIDIGNTVTWNQSCRGSGIFCLSVSRFISCYCRRFSVDILLVCRACHVIRAILKSI